MDVSSNVTEGITPSGGPSIMNASTVQSKPMAVPSRGRDTQRVGVRHDAVSRVSQQRVQHYSPQISHRGRSNFRGKRGGRGNSRNKTHHPDTRSQHAPYYPSPRKYGACSDLQYSDESYHRYSSPVHTYNRYSPLRDTYSPERRREDYDQPPYVYNFYAYENQGFREAQHTRKRGPDQREVAEGGGEYKGEKRKRT